MYGYGYRYNSGLVVGAGGGGAPFTNTYSLDFDGVDDRLQLGSDFSESGTFTVSFWMKPVGFSLNTQKFPMGIFPGNTNFIKLDSLSKMTLKIGGSSNSFTDGGTNNLVLDAWQHIAFIRDSSNVITCYRNGSIFGATVTTSSTLTLNSFGRIVTNSFGFEGGLDEIALFQTDETSNLLNLSTSPTVDLTSLNPYGWYRNGDNGAYKSPQFLIPNNENKDKVSNYSFDLDGIDDYIDLGSDSSLDIFGSDFTISLWAKWGNQTSNSNGLINFAANTNKAVITLGFGSQYGKISFGTGSSSTVGILYDCGSGYNDNNWHHIMCTLQGTTRTIYVDGVDVSSTGSTSSIGVGSNNDIGNRARSRYFVGNIDEVSIFDSIVPIGNLWDGSGEPTTISGAVAHWRMGEESTFSGGVWTVPDAIGSNDGTSNAMTIEDRVGDAPNSENNALSYNMDEVDRVEDTP